MGGRLSLVDVPGHERFVRTMVAGRTGIDLFLLVVDAAEGARPQTHEHLAILRLLGVDRGVVAVTKADAVDEETLELALEEARELVPDAPVVPVSGVTGEGLDDLRAALGEVADAAEQRRADFPARLYVDRVFTLRGIGTVVTGTLWSGSIGEGDQLRLEPAGRDVRVRSVQVHDVPVARAEAGQRVAVNLPGIERQRLAARRRARRRRRVPTLLPAEVALEELEPIADGARLSVHHGTSRIPARVVRVGATTRNSGSRRPSSPRAGIASFCGARRRSAARSCSTPRRRAVATRPRPAARGGRPGLDRSRARPRPGAGRRARRAGAADGTELEEGLDAVRVADGWAFSEAWLEETAAEVERGSEAAPTERRSSPASRSQSFSPSRGRRPFSRSSPSSGAARRSSSRVPPRRSVGGRRRRWRSRTRSPRQGSSRRRSRTPSWRGSSRRRAPRPPRRRLRGRVGRLRAGAGPRATECGCAGEITLARFRDLAGVGRRDAQLLLERMDVDGVTRRIGDRRVLRRGRASG